METLVKDNGHITIGGQPTTVLGEREESLAELLAADERRQRIIEPDREEIRSIFDTRKSKFTSYRVGITFYDKIMGGTPSHPDILSAHIRVSTGISQADENREMMRREFAERHGVAPESAEFDRIIEASESVAKSKSTNGFRRDQRGLFIPTRYVKALMKECCNIAFAGERWGATKKGPKNLLSENVFVDGDRIHLGRDEPDGVDLMIGHVDGPQGRRSTLTLHEYCLQPSIAFTIRSFQDRITEPQWLTMLELAQDIGLGACRSQGYGRFAVTAFDKA